jgi:hypothetical protein
MGRDKRIAAIVMVKILCNIRGKVDGCVRNVK